MTNRQMAEIIRQQQPLTMTRDASVQEACKRMQARKVGAVLVTDSKGKLVGIFTGRDAVRALALARDPVETQLKDIMTKNPTCMPPGCRAIEALRLMRDGGFRHLPVVDEAGRLHGIVSRGDFRGLEQDRLDEETGYWERIA